VPDPIGLEDLGPSTPGVLPNQLLTDAVAAGWIEAGDFRMPDENIQPASLDLRLGEVAYRMRCSFLPSDDTVTSKVKDLVVYELDLRREGAVLETNRPYLIPLLEAGTSIIGGCCGSTPEHIRAFRAAMDQYLSERQ